MNLVHGVDVSVYQPRVDWRLLNSQGFKFAFVRATSGVKYIDPKFAAHWAGAKTEGFLRGAYHYLVAGQDARQQAQLFIATVGSDTGELPPIIDLEDAQNENVSASRRISTCKAVLNIIEGAFGRKPMIYSRKTYLDEHFTLSGKAPAWAKDYDIWVAQYPFSFNALTMPNVNMPQQPSGWKDWKFWQYSETAIVDGVTDENNLPTRIDLDWFRGTEAELLQFAKAQPSTIHTYTIQPGDTFESIAMKFNLSLSELLKANPSLVQAGLTLAIPGKIRTTPPPSTPSTTPSQPPVTPSGPKIIHVVKSGDTLGGIAAKYRTTVDNILVLNPQITNRNVISVGQVIVISA